jgi:hypothetical protein
MLSRFLGGNAAPSSLTAVENLKHFNEKEIAQ